MTLRPEVQEILDATFDDIYFTKDSKYHKAGELRRFGEQNRFARLATLFYHAQDSLDDELAAQVEEVADAVVHPGYLGDKRREAKQRPNVEEQNQCKTLCRTFSEHNRHWKTSGAHGVIHDPTKSIAIFKEKHGDWLYDIKSPVNAANCFLSVIKRRLEDDYWYSDTLEEEVSDQMDLLANNEVPLSDKQEVEKILAYARNGETGALIRAGKAAYGFLVSRGDCEYESFEVECPEVAKFE